MCKYHRGKWSETCVYELLIIPRTPQGACCMPEQNALIFLCLWNWPNACQAKQEKRKETFNICFFVFSTFSYFFCCWVFCLFFLVDLREQGELCSSNTEENPFHHSTVLFYWWTLHPEPPVLPLSLLFCFSCIFFCLLLTTFMSMI